MSSALDASINTRKAILTRGMGANEASSDAAHEAMRLCSVFMSSLLGRRAGAGGSRTLSDFQGTGRDQFVALAGGGAGGGDRVGGVGKGEAIDFTGGPVPLVPYTAESAAVRGACQVCQ